ncbi:MAG: ABC transporter substrate-binding protein [Proteobacteria bacterium]|nr:ABC transporter substrate-binding protein [Pseudomonadota bacterium]
MSSRPQTRCTTRWTRAVAVAAVALSALVPSLASAAGAPETLSFGVLRAPTGALAVVASDKGWFEQAGVKVKPISFAEGGGPAIIQAMAGGEPDVALLNLATAVLALSQSSFDVQIIAVPDDPVMALPLMARAGINSVADLKGKAVSTPSNGGQYYLLARILKAHGMDLKDIDFKPMPIGQAQAAFIAGRLDAVVPSANGMVLIPKALPGAHVIATGRDLGGGKGDPVINPDVLVATRTAIQKHPEALKAFIKAYQGTAVSTLQNPATRKQTIDEIQQYMKSAGAGAQELDAAIKSTDAIQFFSYDESKKLLESAAFRKAVQDQGEFWYAAGVLKTRPDLSKAVNASLMQ